MNWDAIGAVGEVLGAAGVILTLAYLARQITDNSRELKQGSIVAINTLVNEAYDPIYYSERNTRVWISGMNNPENLDEEEQALFSLFMARLANVHMTAFSQYRYETLDNVEYIKYLASLKSILDTPGGQYWLGELRGSDLVGEELRKLMDETETVQRSVVPRPS